jgi:acetyl esterase/lipase
VKVAKDLASYDIPEALAGFRGQILVLAGSKDTTLPPRLSRSLAAGLEARGIAVRYAELKGAGHTNAASNEAFPMIVGDFFHRIRQARAGAVAPN